MMSRAFATALAAAAILALVACRDGTRAAAGAADSTTNVFAKDTASDRPPTEAPVVATVPAADTNAQTVAPVPSGPVEVAVTPKPDRDRPRNGPSHQETDSRERKGSAVKAKDIDYRVTPPETVVTRPDTQRRVISVNGPRDVLPPLDSHAAFLRGDSAFRQDQCAEAIRLYQLVQRPQSLSGDNGGEWLSGRLRTGQCQRRLGFYMRAIEAFQQVVDAEPAEWSAKYELGRTYCDLKVKDFDKGVAELRDMEGPFLGHLPLRWQAPVRALARFGVAACRHQQLLSHSQAGSYPGIAQQARGGFVEFLYSANQLLTGQIDPSMRATLERARDEANTRLKELPDGL